MSDEKIVQLDQVCKNLVVVQKVGFFIFFCWHSAHPLQQNAAREAKTVHLVRRARTVFEKATAFNDFFLEASTLDDSNHEVPCDDFIVDAGLNRIEITLQDVVDQLKCLDTNKSFGPDGISPKFLKEGGEALAIPLLKLYNMSQIMEASQYCPNT